MKNLPMIYRDGYRVDLHFWMSLELYVKHRIRTISEYNSTVSLVNPYRTNVENRVSS